MALGRNSPNYYHSGDDRPTVEMTPGMQGRVQQVKAANMEMESMMAENPGRATTGHVALRKQREVAERALERQIRYQRRQYPVRP